jgi:hypothetical protein
MDTQDDIVAASANATGKRVVCQQVSVEVFAKSIEFLGGFAEMFVERSQGQEEHGYDGIGTDEKVAWAAEQAKAGQVNNLREISSEKSACACVYF